MIRRIGSDGAAIAGIVLAILGGSFTYSGLFLRFAFTGEPIGNWLLPVGLTFLFVGLGLLASKLNAAWSAWRVGRDGQSAVGRIESVTQNHNVQINRQHPWVIEYSFSSMGRQFTGKITTLRSPDPDLQAETEIYVLYDADRPDRNVPYLDL